MQNLISKRVMIYERPKMDESGDVLDNWRLKIFVIYIFNFF